MSNFNKKPSIESKFDTINNFHNNFKKLEGVKSRTEERKQKKTTLRRNASMLYDELNNIYKKSIEKNIIRILKARIKAGGKNIIIRI